VAVLGVNLAIDDLYSTWDESPPPITPGTVVEASDGKKYRLVKNQDTDTATAGYPLVYMDTSPNDNEYEVTADLSDGVDAGAFAGVAITDIDAGEYGFILIDGVYETCTVYNTITAGNLLVVAATDGGFLPATTANVTGYAGVALEAASGAGAHANLSVWVKGL